MVRVVSFIFPSSFHWNVTKKKIEDAVRQKPELTPKKRY